MALELPSYAIPAFDELNVPWPGIDEDQLRAWAASVRAYGDDMSATSGRVSRAVTDLAEESRSSFTDALAAYWEQQGQLTSGLNGVLDAFAAALDTAASQVVTQKQAVINAAIELTSQLIAPQAPPANPPVTEQAAQAARTRQISQARQTVSAVLESLEADLSGPLLNVAVPQVTDYANGLADSLRADAVPAPVAVGTLRLSYSSLHRTAQTIRSQAGATDKSGESAYAQNANRDLRDQGSGIGDPVGDGGRWQSVLQAVEQALGDVASVLFTITSEAISHYQKVTANALDKFADEVRGADASERVHDHTAARDSQLAFKIQENAGAKAAAKLLTELRQGEITNAQFDAQLFAQLRAHENDPGWQTGAMRALGSTYLYYLVCEGHIPAAGKGEPQDANMKALAMAVAAAMAHGVAFPARVDGAATPATEDLETYSEATISPLLQYARFPPQVLATLAYEATIQGDAGGPDPYAPAIWTALLANPQALKLFAGRYANLPPQELANLGKQAMTYTYPPDPGAPPPTVIWAALAANPEAANLFVRENAGAIPSFASGATQSELPGDQASLFAGVLKSAAVGFKGTDPKLAAQAVSDLVMSYKRHPDQHAPAPIEAEYGDIIEAYWPDLQFELVNKTGVGGKVPSPDGMHLTLADWSPFLDEALRNPTTAASVLQFGHTQAYQYQLKAGELDGDTGDVYMWDQGFIDGYLDYQAKTVYSELYKEDQAKASQWKSQLETVVDDVVSSGIQSGGDPAAFGLDIAADVATEIVNRVINDLPSDGGSPPPPLYWEFQANYASAAVTTFTESTPANLDGDAQRQALVASAMGKPFVKYGGPHGQDPHIPQPQNMTPEELAAFNAWLNNPAVFEYFYHPGPAAAGDMGYYAVTTTENQGG